MSQNVLDTLQAQEAAGSAKLEAELEDNIGGDERKKLSDRLKEHMVILTSENLSERS